LVVQEALAEFWNVCLACPTAADENAGAGHMAKILDFFLIPLSVTVLKMTVKTEEICTAKNIVNNIFFS
jgi:hypothetical protein